MFKRSFQHSLKYSKHHVTAKLFTFYRYVFSVDSILSGECERQLGERVGGREKVPDIDIYENHSIA